jgi:hypothetical protein
VNKWIRNTFGKQVIKIKFNKDNKKTENTVQIFNYSFIIKFGNETDKLLFVQKIPLFYDHFLKPKISEDFISNNKIHSMFYDILMSQKISLYIGALETHKRRKINDQTNENSSEQFKRILDKILDELFEEIKEKTPSVYMEKIFERYSSLLILIQLFVKRGIPSPDFFENIDEVKFELFKKRKSKIENLTKNEREFLNERFSNKFFCFSQNGNKEKDELQSSVFEFWEKLGAANLPVEESLDLLDYLIQEWCLISKFLSFYLKGYYGNNFFRQ